MVGQVAPVAGVVEEVEVAAGVEDEVAPVAGVAEEVALVVAGVVVTEVVALVADVEEEAELAGAVLGSEVAVFSDKMMCINGHSKIIIVCATHRAAALNHFPQFHSELCHHLEQCLVLK